MHYPLRQAQNAVLSHQNLHQDISGQGARTHRREGRASALCNALPQPPERGPDTRGDVVMADDAENGGPVPKQGVNRGNAGKGRPKGSPNKITADIKRAILEAAEAAGGEGGTVGYLTAQATANPAAFMTLLGKVLPTTLANDPDNPLPAAIAVHFVKPDGQA